MDREQIDPPAERLLKEPPMESFAEVDDQIRRERALRAVLKGPGFKARDVLPAGRQIYDP
jgi:hypothetical protein